MKIFRKIKKQFTLQNIYQKAKENPLRAIVIGILAILFVVAFFSSNGIYARLKLESQKKEIQEKIRTAEEEQEKLKAASKALEGDDKAIEKVAREKYGMVREGEKVYKVKPKE
ncbi:MAG: septum formation initiator family protein [Bacteroidetes bacterium]|nr:septum formation initiator family protein [Bacteroidota bacterium]